MLGHAGAPHDDLSLLTSWTFDPLAVIAIAVAAFLYYRRARTLARRGAPVAAWRRVSFGLGLGLLALALFSPLDAWGEEQFFFVHMVQHVLLGEVAPLAIVAGLTGPLLRPLLAYRVVQRLRVLAHPLIAWPLWAVNLYLWHLPFLYEAALGNDAVHAAEHVAFFTAGALFWAPVLEPLPAPRWFGSGAKLLYIVAARFTGMVLANILAWADDPIYDEYVHDVARYGISASADQGIAGSTMMVVDSVITIAAIAWLFLKLAGESERRQQLIEAGADPEAAARVVRYGRG
ncbi:MAG TPA: cytochrome c oxidase assembly protein [Gaiellaceae bacterium]|nr:cytochrome c oxidase assembly protein [Gaiellaceae bacterium]